MQDSLSAIILDTTQLRPGTLPMLNGFGIFPYLRGASQLLLLMVWAYSDPSEYDSVAALECDKVQ
jgi:hypothetical protein